MINQGSFSSSDPTLPTSLDRSGLGGVGSLGGSSIDDVLDEIDSKRETMANVVDVLEALDVSIDSAVEAIVVLTLVRGEVTVHSSDDNMEPLMIAEAYTNL